MGPIRRVASWIADRLAFGELSKLARRRVPAEIGGRKGWWYIFGNAALVVFVLQVLTGIALVTMYVPTPERAYQSVLYITEEAWFGWILRALHFFGASAMVVLVVVHVARVFLTGSYKFPREMTWITGVVLGVLVLAMAFTGQLLRWDDAGLWGVSVAAHFVERVPWIGPALADLVLGGDTVGGVTLSRFFAFHAFILPGLIALIVGLHVFLVAHHGISEPPKAGEPVDPATYREKYQSLKKRGVPHFPDVAWREAVFGAFVVAVIVTLALVHGPVGPAEPADPTDLHTNPKPDWFVIWYYALLYLKGRGLETFVMVYLPILVLVGLLLFPLVFSRGERAPSKRPWAIAIVVTVLLVFGSLIALGYAAPWAPAVDTEPLGEEELGGAPPEVLSGALTFFDQGCQYCHRVVGHGGRYGPDLTDVAARLSPEEIAVRIVYGFGDMPSYREQLSREELDSIVLFLRALREHGRAS